MGIVMGRGISFLISYICALSRMKSWLRLMTYAFPTLHPSQPHTPQGIDEMSAVTQANLRSWEEAQGLAALRQRLFLRIL